MPKKGKSDEAALIYERTFTGDDFELRDGGIRQQSFLQPPEGFEWPFLEGCDCTPDKMAAAGFYYVGTDAEPDLVRCYFCRRELDGWEPTDDPWAEHKRRYITVKSRFNESRFNVKSRFKE